MNHAAQIARSLPLLRSTLRRLERRRRLYRWAQPLRARLPGHARPDETDYGRQGEGQSRPRSAALGPSPLAGKAKIA